MAGTGAQTPAGGDRRSRGDGAQMTPQEAADYIASLLDGLRLVAHNAELPFLGYLISVALEEAKSAKSNQASQAET